MTNTNPTTTAVATTTALDDLMTEALALARQSVDAAVNPLRQSMALAKGLQMFRQALTTPEAAETLRSLAGTSLGFLTDKDRSGGYAPSILADCAIEACARGVNLTGNEFNIISGRCYITKAGMKRLLGNLGVKHAVTCGLPEVKGEAVVIPVTIQWQYNGETKSQRLEFPTRQNAGMGIDALQGKAIRKARAWLYETITGLDAVDGDAESAAMTAAPAPTAPTAPAEKPGRKTLAGMAAAAAPADDYTLTN